MTQKILVIGATGLLGTPVTRALIKAGFAVTVLVRNSAKAQALFPQAHSIAGDLNSLTDLEKAMQGQDAIYLNLSVKQDEKATDWHAESEGLDNILKIAKAQNIQRISYLSSIINFYQGMNGFDWWVFKIKQAAVQKIKNSGIAYSIFYPSTFMESIFYQSKQGNKIALGGKSEHPMWYIAADDYGQQVVNAFKVLAHENRDYFVQGPESFTQEQAAKVFIHNYTKEKLGTLWAPMWVMKIMGSLVQRFNYAHQIIEAMNKYPETFQAQLTWKELGKPQTTLANFAKNL